MTDLGSCNWLHGDAMIGSIYANELSLISYFSGGTGSDWLLG
jgi:hypothetical protein